MRMTRYSQAFKMQAVREVIGPEPLCQRLAAAGAALAGKYGQQVERNGREQEAQLRVMCQ